MIRKEVLDQIVYLSDEEQANLNGQDKIDTSIFLNEASKVVDYHKILNEDDQISIRKHARFRDYPEHSHNFIELVYVYSGQITNVIEGTEIVLNEGEFIMFDRNVRHSIKRAEENDIAFNIIILPKFIEYLSPLIDNENELSSFLFKSLYDYDNAGTYMVFKVGECEDVRECCEHLIETLYGYSLFKTSLVRLILGELLVKLIEKKEMVYFENTDHYDSQLMLKIRNYIVNHYEDASLTELANSFKMKDYQLSKFIKKQTGVTFKELVLDEKLKESERLLVNSDLSITQIMEKVGYENATYFYRVFKDKYGVTPKLYREVANKDK